MSSVLFLVHPDRPDAKELALEARRWWEARGDDVVDMRDVPDGFEVADLEIPGSDTPEFAVSFGGDGTMLRTVQAALPHGIPVLGVNLGRMGYLAEVEPSGMEGAFERLVSGDYRVEERVSLAVSIKRADGVTSSQGSAVNEAIVARNAPGHTIRVGVEIGGVRFLNYVADGLLVCTPTGSTAYNLSAGGPVVAPGMRALVLTPVAPHLIFDRSLVLGPDEPVTITILDGRPGTLVLDGSRLGPLEHGDAVTCEVAPRDARFVTFGAGDFHAVLRSRFSLADR